MAVILDPNVYDVGVKEGVGPLENGDLVVLVLDSTYAFDPEEETVADLVDHEVTGGDYDRETITATVDRVNDVWVALPDSTPSFDLTGIVRGGFLVARDGATDADRKLVRWFPDPSGPENPAEPSMPDGILQARIDTGQAAGVQSVTGDGVDNSDPANPVMVSPVPDPTSGVDGQVPTISGGAYVLAASSGGSSWSLVNAGDLGIYTDGTYAFVASDHPLGDVAIDTPALLATLPPGVRPLNEVGVLRRWRNLDVSMFDPGDFGEAVIAVQTSGEVIAMDHTGSLGSSDEVRLDLVGLGWLVAS